MEQNEVNIAFEILLEKIEKVFNFLNEEGETAFKTQDYEKARQLNENGEKLKQFQEKIKVLQTEWQNLFSKRVYSSSRKRKSKGRLKRGLRTPESEFKIPILEAIVSLGGEGKTSKILELVFQKIKHKLNTHDLEPRNSNPEHKRWENTAHWTRYSLINEGLLSDNSPQGIWEITEKGRSFLGSQN
ncbi:MAG TPA: winged helix-turn-helix domain-containing protein [Candidatus Hydrogenedens sp.]|nr:winged helix-turn-helix domain-containing protein [Candidatus Hydrogenedens sp.]HOL20960.1 winged helix-turn-helix domain-containing protein [Candidatus Hydrogenedens sp.]HPP60032.1 winged helix-turn-helix domain-containing protein [Candidatus Hydrogenedens sp.]